MIRRCYSESNKIKFKSYVNHTICDEWLIFHNFENWYDSNYPKHIDGIKFEIDKDLMQLGIENKIYSPDTAIFLPKRVNNFIIGKLPNKSTGEIGVCFDKDRNKYVASCTDFYTHKKVFIGRYDTIEEALDSYKLNKSIQIDRCKEYLRNLNYLSEEIINKIGDGLI